MSKVCYLRVSNQFEASVHPTPAPLGSRDGSTSSTRGETIREIRDLKHSGEPTPSLANLITAPSGSRAGSTRVARDESIREMRTFTDFIASFGSCRRRSSSERNEDTTLTPDGVNNMSKNETTFVQIMKAILFLPFLISISNAMENKVCDSKGIATYHVYSTTTWRPLKESIIFRNGTPRMLYGTTRCRPLKDFVITEYIPRRTDVPVQVCECCEKHFPTCCSSFAKLLWKSIMCPISSCGAVPYNHWLIYVKCTPSSSIIAGESSVDWDYFEACIELVDSKPTFRLMTEKEIGWIVEKPLDSGNLKPDYSKDVQSWVQIKSGNKPKVTEVLKKLEGNDRSYCCCNFQICHDTVFRVWKILEPQAAIDWKVQHQTDCCYGEHLPSCQTGCLTCRCCCWGTNVRKEFWKFMQRHCLQTLQGVVFSEPRNQREFSESMFVDMGTSQPELEFSVSSDAVTTV